MKLGELKKGNKNVLDFVNDLGFGYYCINANGQFVHCDKKAREIFGIPEDETDLSRYSIANLYVVPAERDWRIHRLMENRLEPLCSTLYVRIKNKTMLIFDICWCDDSDGEYRDFAGLVSKIEEGTLFPKMFETFPYGLYEVDDKNQILRANIKMAEIFKYKNESDLLGKGIEDFYEHKNDLVNFTNEIETNGYAHQILKLKDSYNNILDIECFSRTMKPIGKARWGMMVDVTKSESYYRALDDMPTGYYHIEKEKVTHCNNRFAQIMGFKRWESAIGIDTRKYFLNKEAGEIYFRELEANDAARKPLQGYELQIKRANDKKIITVSIDARLIRDHTGKIIGREGTIRDVTDRVELENQVKEVEGNLKKTTEDINKFIHTFLHPVVKFSGFSELMNHISNTLQTSKKFDKLAPHLPDDPGELGPQLVKKLSELLEQLSSIEKSINFPGRTDDFDTDERHELLFLANFNDKLARIVNRLDYSVKTDKKTLVESRIRDTSLWVLDELNKIDTSRSGKLDSLVQTDIIGFLQHILRLQSIRSSGVLMSEVKTMEQEVESLRAYIGMKKERKYFFTKHDLHTILEENIEGFKPSLSEKEVDINYISSGNLQAEISGHDIERVLWNLINNALKYSYFREGRFITLRAKELQPADMVEISIENFGIPIKKEEIESGKIWEFGYRGEKALESDRDGTGVGLADAKDVVEAHGGEISITSEPKGRKDDSTSQYDVPYVTTVTIRLPKKQRGAMHGS